uniref:Uncharacterized protein n=1 Tax=Hyaloperonospora arabidopsidis (strain Emoy2) TaxID=559515 RepID=M4BS00_HYAAE
MNERGYPHHNSKFNTHSAKTGVLSCCDRPDPITTGPSAYPALSFHRTMQDYSSHSVRPTTLVRKRESMVGDFYIKTRARRVSVPAGGLVSGLSNLEMRSFCILR